MSLFKRKTSCSIDPIQKQKKFKQTQYYTLLDKCLQIPTDDKLIIRKSIAEYDETLISLLEKYRKQAPKDLKDLQIYLRKFVQKYKIQHPKYPILKMGQSIELSQSLQKRKQSTNVSVSTTGKISLKIKQNESSKQSNKKLSLSSSLSCLNLIKNNNTLKQKGDKNECHPNYQKLINKRKSQKLKVTRKQVKQISFSVQSIRSLMKQQQNENITLHQNQRRQRQFYNTYHQEISLDNIKNNNLNHQIDFLQTMRYKMKRDQNQNQNKSLKSIKKNQLNIEIPQDIIIQTNNHIIQKQRQINSINKINKNTNTINQTQEIQNSLRFMPQVKRKLFDSKKQLYKNNSLIQGLQQLKKQNKKQSNQKRPLTLTQLNENQLHCRKQSFQFNISQISNCSQYKQRKVNVIQHDFKTNILDQQNIYRQNQNITYHRNMGSLSLTNCQFSLNCQISTVRKNQSNQNQSLYYLNSQRKKSQLFSHRLNNHSICMNSSIKQKDTLLIKQKDRLLIKQKYESSIKQQYQPSIKQQYQPSIKQQYQPSIKQQYQPLIKSIKQKDEISIKQKNETSKMIFSHRMQQVISGRKPYQEQKNKNRGLCIKCIKNGDMKQNCSCIQKTKGTPNKLQFWSRIQQAINK